MKILWKFLWGCLFIGLIGCGENQPAMENAAGSFHSQFSKAVDEYFKLKDAMVAGDAQRVIEMGRQLSKCLKEIPRDSLPPSSDNSWQQRMKAAEVAVSNMIAAEDIEAQREEFLDLSETFIDRVKAFGPMDSPVYVQHCPMAFDNSGGDWLSNSSKIYNPYFGDKMLHCGTVTDTLKSQN